MFRAASMGSSCGAHSRTRNLRSIRRLRLASFRALIVLTRNASLRKPGNGKDFPNYTRKRRHFEYFFKIFAQKSIGLRLAKD
jgi:hypothetical protein